MGEMDHKREVGEMLPEEISLGEAILISRNSPYLTPYIHIYYYF
jgi:hypothetical protein